MISGFACLCVKVNVTCYRLDNHKPLTATIVPPVCLPLFESPPKPARLIPYDLGRKSDVIPLFVTSIKLRTQQNSEKTMVVDRVLAAMCGVPGAWVRLRSGAAAALDAANARDARASARTRQSRAELWTYSAVEAAGLACG